VDKKELIINNRREYAENPIKSRGKICIMDVKIKQAIDQIIGSIPSQCYFDAHFVIKQLYEEYSALYEANRLSYASVEKFHSEVSLYIKSLKMVEDSGHDSFSYNIHNRPSSNKCWFRI